VAQPPDPAGLEVDPEDLRGRGPVFARSGATLDLKYGGADVRASVEPLPRTAGSRISAS